MIKHKEEKDSPFISPPIFSSLPVRGFFTTKILNGDIGAISQILSIPPSKIYKPIQKHTDRIILYESDMGQKIGDSVITNQRNILIGIDVADCVPILIYDKKLHVIGAVHAGWRGTCQQILKKTLKKLVDTFKSSPENILIAMGPAIRICCYEVGHEVFKAVKDSSGEGEYYLQKGGKYYLDLPRANLYQILSLGIPINNIWISEDCTHCQPHRFYSYRYSKGKTGSQSGFIGIFDR